MRVVETAAPLAQVEIGVYAGLVDAAPALLAMLVGGFAGTRVGPRRWLLTRAMAQVPDTM